ncbi:uncharacterized protein LOC141903579 [Tubulanus polymorphus]|uniref:uncharacterized protein LOC141903579 n=1 Tax=Tubulanus polymorphus TaxID=672921 RepID=UPI003DA36935
MNVGYHRASCLELPPSGKQRRSTTDGAALLAKVVKVASQTTGATAESVPVVAKSEIRVVATDPSEEYIDMSGTNLSQYSGASSVVHSRNNSSVSDSTDCDYIMMKTPPIYDDSADYIDMSGRGCVKLPDAKSGGIAATESSLSSTAIISVNPVDIDVSSKLVSRHTTMSQRLDSAGIDEATIRDLKLPVHGSYVQFLMANHGGEIKRCNSAGMINDKSKTSSIKHTFTRSNSLRLLMNSDDNNSMIFSSLKPSVSMDGCIDAQNIETGYESWSKSQINSDSTDSVTQSDTDLKRFKQRHGYAKMKSSPRPKSMAWGGDNKRHSKLPTFFRRLMRRSSFDRRKHRNHDNVSTDSEDAVSPVEATKSVATTTAAETTDENSKTTHKRSESLPRNVFSRKTRSESTDSEITNTPPPSGSGGVDDDDETLVISNESIQSSKSYQSSKKKPSRVKRSMSYHCPGTSSSSSAIIDFVDVSDGRSHSVSNPIPISSPGGSSFRLSRSHGTTVTIPEDNEPVWMPTKIKAKDAAKFGHAGFDTTSRGAESRGALSSSEVVGDYMDSLSLSSHGSSDAHAGGRQDDILKTSPAATVLRPRSGKQYQKLDRKKLAEDLNCNGGSGAGAADSTQTTPISPTSSTSVFTFDQEMNGSPTRNSYFSSHGNDSPKSPHEVAAALRGHKQQRGGGISGATGGDQRIYMNVRESPKMMYMNTMDTPPGTPPQFGVSPQALEQINPLLNYAELDLSPGRSKEQQQQQQQTTNGKQLLSSSPQLNYADIDLSGQSSSKESKRSSKVKRTVPRDGLTSYAQIDHSATKAAQKANKEHAQFREDNSRKKERKTSSPMVGSKERKSITPVSMIRSRAGSMSSGSQ